MKSVLFSTDFVRRSDGTLTPVEINTNTGHAIKFDEIPITVENFTLNLDGFMSHEDLNTFMIENNITKLITIDHWNKFNNIFKIFCDFYGYEHEIIILEPNSINIPDVDENENELVIRIAYDNYSIFDDLYARDMFEFHNLIKDEPFASPVTFLGEDELDTISELEPSIDGVIPNYVLKPRFPAYNKQEYPKLYRFENEEKLNNSKSNLGPNEFLQKYEISPSHVEENGNTVYFYRSIDLLIKNTFDVINVFSYKKFNSVRVDNEVIIYDYEIDENHKMNDAMALKYYPLWYTRTDFMYHFDDTDKILLSNNELLNSNELKLGDSVLSIKYNISGSGNYNSNRISLNNLNEFELSESKVSNISGTEKPNLFINIKAINEEYGEITWYDGWSTPYLITKTDTDITKFSHYSIGLIEIDDIIHIYDYNKNKIIPFTVTEITFDIKNIKTYTVDLNGIPKFFVKVTDNENDGLYLIQHNSNCEEECRNSTVFDMCSNYSFYCGDCGKNSTNCDNCGGTSASACVLRYLLTKFSSTSALNACSSFNVGRYVNWSVGTGADIHAVSSTRSTYKIYNDGSASTKSAIGWYVNTSPSGKGIAYWDGYVIYDSFYTCP